MLPLEEELKAEAKKRQGQRNDIKNIPQNSAESGKGAETREELAEMAGVSRDTISKVKKLIADADDETKDKLRSGEVSIHRAYTELKENLAGIPSADRYQTTETDTEGRDVGRNTVEAQPGDIIPGFRAENVPGQIKGGCIEREPDTVYGIPPIEVYGNMPSDNLALRGNAEMTHARSDLQSSTDNYVRRVGEILRGMSAASVSTENMKILKAIVTSGYDQIMDLINQAAY